MPKKIRILSLDGGGIRGILPGVILSHLEGLLQRRGRSGSRLSDYFDLIAGTSTGGILACGYLIPGDAQGPPHARRAKYTAAEILDIYLERGDSIFSTSLLDMVTTFDGRLDEKYQADALEDALSDHFGDCLLSDLLKPCLITAYDIYNRRAHFFNSTDTTSPGRDFLVRDVARATSAAPTFFEASMVRSTLGVGYAMIDGGVIANNPTMCAYSEARSIDFSAALSDPALPKKPSARNMMIVSIGTGQDTQPYEWKNAKDWGPLGWAVPLINIMMSGASEIVHYQLQKIFDTLSAPDHLDYHRLQPDLYMASPVLDDTSAENIGALQEAGLKFIADNEGYLEKIADRLIAIGDSADDTLAPTAGQ